MVNPSGAVRITLDAEGADGVRLPFFECRTCDVLLRWNPVVQLWMCPECVYELNVTEAEMLIDEARQALRLLDQYVCRKSGKPRVDGERKGFWRWLWEKLFKKRELPGPSVEFSKSD